MGGELGETGLGWQIKLTMAELDENLSVGKPLDMFR